MEAIFAEIRAEEERIRKSLEAIDLLAVQLNAKIVELERQNAIYRHSAMASAELNQILHGQLARLALATMFQPVAGRA